LITFNELAADGANLLILQCGSGTSARLIKKVY